MKTLSNLRKLKGLTQQEVARRAGVSLATWHNFEAGRGNPELKTLQAVLEILGLEIVLHQKSIDWNLLGDLGVPLIGDDRRVKIRLDGHLLVEKLNQLSSQLSHIAKDTREEKALASFFMAVKDHYPQLWRTLDGELKQWMNEHADNSSIKLRRISIQNLAAYL